jgi:hypothetical protein
MPFVQSPGGVQPGEPMMPACLSCDFDFDAWSDIARRDPENFEASRRAEINRVISKTDGQQQLALKRLQFRIDAERMRSRTPLKSCLRISSMMWDSFIELNARLDAVAHAPLPRDDTRALIPRQATAVILSFPGRRKISAKQGT